MAIDSEDLEPRATPPTVRNLETLSIAELEAYIGELEAEIARTRDTIAAKRNQRAGADAFFKKR